MKELKNGRSTIVRCNGKKLKEVMIQKGLDPHDVAETLHYSRSYFNKPFREGEIGVRCVTLLKENFSIDPASYGVATKRSSAKDKVIRKRERRNSSLVTSPIVLNVTIDPVQLRDLIKEAVMEAFEEL